MNSLLNDQMPLVSILIPNYNYGQYLRYCIDSVLAQTYPNIEIIIQDNASSDNSYDILIDYELKYLHGEINTYINVGRNKYNVGSDRNSTICFGRSEGDYFMFLSSDDAIAPTFVERCVKVLIENPSVGMVMVHRNEIDENGTIYETPSFYNKSFIIDGESQAAVFMVAGIAVPSQVMMRRTTREKMLRHRNYQLMVAGDWYNNFLFSCVTDIGYIKDPLVEYRIHTGNETSESEKKLLGIFEHYILINAFNATANSLHFHKPQKRFVDATEKLGDMCLRYANKMFQNNENEIAKRYLDLSIVFKPQITIDERFILLKNIYQAKNECDRRKLLDSFNSKFNLTRTVSYDPPVGFIPLAE